MKKYLYAGLLLLAQAGWADSYSSGPTIRNVLLAQDSFSITVDGVVDLQILGYGLLIRSVDNGGEAKWISLSEGSIKLFGGELQKIDSSVKFGSGIQHLLKIGGAKRPVFLFLQIYSIDRNEASAIGGWSYNEAEPDSLNKFYKMRFIKRADAQWEIVKLMEVAEVELIPYLKVGR